MAVPLTLKVFKGDELVVAKDYDRDIIKIGRLSSAHLCLDDEKVSRIHSVIEVAPDGSLSIIDMGSVEGTFVNGKRVNKGALQFGDEVKVGNTTIKVEAAGAAPSIAPSAPSVAAVAAAPAEVAAPMVVPVAVPVVQAAVVQQVVQQVPVQAPPVARQPPPPPPSAVLDEATGASVRSRPRRRKGSGPLGVELRFLWGDQMVGEYFLHPDVERTFTVGTTAKSHFNMGDSKFGAPTFDLVRFGKAGASLRFTSKMNGELQRKFGEETMTLDEAKKKNIATADGDGLVLTLQHEDFAWIDLGGIVVEVFFQPQPKAVFVPFAESVDFTVLNIFLLMFFIAALFVISAANLNAEGEAFDDELNSNSARIAKLLIKPPEKNPILQKFEKKKDSGEVAQKHKDSEGQMGKKEAPKRSAHAAPKGDPNNKDQARLLVAKVFGGTGGGISTIFGHQGLGGELKSAMGNMFGAAAGDSGGFGGLGLRGSGSGGGGVGDTVGIGGIGTKGRGGGTGGYGSGVGVLGGKKDIDIGITSSEPMVMGSLDKELIRKVIHANRGQIRYCYESQLNRFPKLNGKVAVKFIISPTGSVSTSSVAQTTVGNAELEACVAGRVRTWTFPKPKGGGVVIVTYPFIFAQSGGQGG
ncbi:MAG: adventurous gliding motility protein GltG [Archangium sp.]|nr:adventurous gliding motility protein GltG [Archangium sp.]MDP3157993.1 adventurous gliding motility protein GltG [Archangium sp.]MDP3574879.1 adventurous gliding motility protein GltG [Archangium sp.]